MSHKTKLPRLRQRMLSTHRRVQVCLSLVDLGYEDLCLRDRGTDGDHNCDLDNQSAGTGVNVPEMRDEGSLPPVHLSTAHAC